MNVEVCSLRINIAMGFSNPYISTIFGATSTGMAGRKK
jgi:hypothetical protein